MEFYDIFNKIFAVESMSYSAILISQEILFVENEGLITW